MNPDRLLSHFDRISEALDAIPRLRQLILSLAVRGKLVDQSSKNVPASRLLGDHQFFPNPERQPWKLPPGWAWSCYQLLGETMGGGTPTKANPEFWDGSIPWVSPKDMKVEYIEDAQDHISELALDHSAVRLVPAGSLLMVVRGMILAHSFPVAITGVPVTINQDMKAIVPFLTDLSRMLLLISKGVKPEVLRLVSHSTHGTCKLPTNDLFSLPLPIPPLEEQHRIVAKVDELMGLCDRLEAARDERERRRDRLAAASLHRINQPVDAGDASAFREHARFHLAHLPRLTTRPDQIPALRQTILNLAVRGKLVPQDPNDEPASALLKRIEIDSKSYALEQGIAAPKPEPILDSAVAQSTPPGWSWTRLCCMFRVITDGDHQPPPKSDDGIAFLTIGNITTGKIDFSNCRFVQEEYFRAVASYRKPSFGDILYTVVGATYGRPAYVDTRREFCVQRHIAILKPAKEVDVRFLCSMLASPLVYEQATQSITGTAQPTIPLRPLRNFLVLFPPLPEQHRIMAKVDELMAICDCLEAQLTAAQTESGRLLEAVLHEAISA